MIISLQPNVRLTSNQAVFLKSVVLRSIKNDQLGPWRDPGGSFIDKGHPKSILGSICIQELLIDRISDQHPIQYWQSEYFFSD